MAVVAVKVSRRARRAPAIRLSRVHELNSEHRVAVLSPPPVHEQRDGTDWCQRCFMQHWIAYSQPWTEETMTLCPVPSAHRRLMECHDQWHRLADDYMVPAEFRATLNRILQELRNVTFLLQKDKAGLRGFSEWYPAWQARAKEDPIARWIVKSRNRVVKESDLEVESRVRITYTRGFVDGQQWESAGNPTATTRQLMIRFLSTASINRPSSGIVSIDRTWIDVALPNQEILDATREAYASLMHLMVTCHRNQGIEECDLGARRRPCVTAGLHNELPMCMQDIGRVTTLAVDLEDGQEFRSETRTHLKSPDLEEDYGIEHFWVKGDALANVDAVLKTAMKMVRKDGRHELLAHLWRGALPIGHFDIPSMTRSLGSRFFSSVADQVRKTDADSCLITWDMWIRAAHKRPNTSKEMDQLPIVGEMLLVLAANSDGRVRWRHWVYKGEGASDDNLSGRSLDLSILYPLRRVWAIDEWDTVDLDIPFNPPPDPPPGWRKNIPSKGLI